MSPGELQANGRYTCIKDGRPVQLMPKYVRQYNLGRTYEPSYNVAPTDLTPVLISRAHLTEEIKDIQKRSIVPMMWGIIPRFHKGDYKKHGYHTNNARLEGVMDNRIFKPALVEGQRCVVLVEGFYEWDTMSPGKTPYFIHAEQKSKETHIEDRGSWPENVEDLVLLKMAALFDIWTDASGDQMWAYTVLTRESDDVLGWLHHRTPVFLETEQQINDWLDYKRQGPEEAIAQLTPIKTRLAWHQVSTRVNSSRHKAEDCNKRVVEGKAEKNKSMMGKITNFFSTAKKDQDYSSEEPHGNH